MGLGDTSVKARSRRGAALATLALAGLLAASAAGPARAATAADVDKAIAKGVKYLYSKQKPDGSWEAVPKRDQKSGPPTELGGQWGGATALAAYALIAAGEDVHSPRLAKAIEWLKHADLVGVYALGTRCQVWLLMPQTPETRKLISADAEELSHGFNGNPKTKSGYLYGYLTNKKDLNEVDHSSSQFGVLGMWAAEQVKPESVSSGYWAQVEQRWVHDQQGDGGWYYRDAPSGGLHEGTQASMTAAGVATLFITQDYTHPERMGKCDGNVTNPAIDKGLAYMASHLNDWVPGQAIFGTPIQLYSAYTLYGVERIGVASGLKYIGATDWYQWGADWCVAHQNPDGEWTGPNDLDNSSFCLLFLARGRAPILINKVQYDDADGPNAGKPGRWNQRPRDVANLVRWAGRQTERDLNWQITNLKVADAELHDAPFLYLSGNQPLRLAADDKQKLKRFCQQGGMVLFNADCGGGTGTAAAQQPFVASVSALAKTLFPDYEFRDLPASHPIYAEQFLPRGWKRPPTIRGLSNGVRELMILLPDDPAKAWQLRQTLGAGKEEAFQSMQDIILYATDKRPLRVKGSPFLVTPDEKVTATRTIKVGRLKYAGNWDPEPGGWPRLAAVLHNTQKVDLDVQPVELGKNALAAFAVVDLTGTTPVKLSAAQQEELKDYVTHGGTLVVDAAGGSTPFSSAAEALLNAMFPRGLAAPLPPTDAVFHRIDPRLEVRYRTYAKAMLGRLTVPQVKAITVAGRPGVYYSREDLSGGLVGQDVDGVLGYEPATATAIMGGIVLTAAK